MRPGGAVEIAANRCLVIFAAGHTGSIVAITAAGTAAINTTHPTAEINSITVVVQPWRTRCDRTRFITNTSAIAVCCVARRCFDSLRRNFTTSSVVRPIDDLALFPAVEYSFAN
jgi:Mn2+/Fe2+ NRAMP family transporter